MFQNKGEQFDICKEKERNNMNNPGDYVTIYVHYSHLYNYNEGYNFPRDENDLLTPSTFSTSVMTTVGESQGREVVKE